ncbi:MAG: helix-turn-helix transcriptional regulator [Candidatus Malihini olakiniferum]
MAAQGDKFAASHSAVLKGVMRGVVGRGLTEEGLYYPPFCTAGRFYRTCTLYHIEKSIFSNITLDDITERAFSSTCYLSRAFKKATGTKFSTYVANRKIKIAKSLLKFSDLNVNTILMKLAYQDASYFCLIFKKETNI